jgi:hypothetical protein
VRRGGGGRRRGRRRALVVVAAGREEEMGGARKEPLRGGGGGGEGEEAEAQDGRGGKGAAHLGVPVLPRARVGCSFHSREGNIPGAQGIFFFGFCSAVAVDRTGTGRIWGLSIVFQIWIIFSLRWNFDVGFL